MDHRTLARAFVYAIACALVLGVATGVLMRAELATPQVEGSPALHSMVLSLHAFTFGFGLVPLMIAATFGVRMLPTLLGRAELAGLWLAFAGLVASLLGMAVFMLVRVRFDARLDAGPVDVDLSSRVSWSLLGLGQIGLGLCLLANGVIGRARLLVAPLALGLALLGLGFVIGGGMTLATALNLLGELDDAALPSTWLEFGGVALVGQALMGDGDSRPAARGWLALGLVGMGAAALLDGLHRLGSPASMALATLGTLALIHGAWLQLRDRPIPAGPLRTFVGLYALAFVLRSLAAAYLATLRIDVHIHDTYFVHALDHLRTLMTLGLALPIGVLWCWPTIAPGRALRPSWWHASAWLGGASLLAYFGIAAWLGHQGMPRRYITYLPEYELMQRSLSLVTIGVVLGPLLAVIDLARASWEQVDS